MQSFSVDDTKLEAQVALQRNRYFAHPESILLVAIVDSNEKIANDALMKILEARKANDVTSLRVFSKQGISLNFGTTSYYYDMINWSSVEISPPPILQNITDAELSIRVARKTLAIPDFPCHSQGIERLIKEVTRASPNIYSFQYFKSFREAYTYTIVIFFEQAFDSFSNSIRIQSKSLHYTCFIRCYNVFLR